MERLKRLYMYFNLFFKTTSCLQSKRLYRLGHGHGDHTVGTGFTNIYLYDATTNNKWEENSSKQICAKLIWSACLVQRLGANTSNALAERKEGQRLLAYQRDAVFYGVVMCTKAPYFTRGLMFKTALFTRALERLNCGVKSGAFLRMTA